jgi:uncharacterized membrane protein YgdD (TMEM256/DUF423 family)
MNQVFSFKRFGMLFKKHTVENFRGYLMSLIVLMGILAIVMIIIDYNIKGPMDERIQMVLFVLFLFLAGCIFTSNVFINLGDKRKAIAMLTLPCSSFEKFFVGWLFSFFIFQAIYILVFYVILIPVLHMGNWPASQIHLTNVFNNIANDASITFVAYAFLHSVVIFGAVHFKKMHFIKTAFVFFIMGLVISLGNNQVLKLIFNRDILGNPPFGGVSFKEANNYITVSLANESYHWVLGLFLLLSVIVWFATYFRLKEKQV